LDRAGEILTFQFRIGELISLVFLGLGGVHLTGRRDRCCCGTCNRNCGSVDTCGDAGISSSGGRSARLRLTYTAIEIVVTIEALLFQGLDLMILLLDNTAQRHYFLLQGLELHEHVAAEIGSRRTGRWFATRRSGRLGTVDDGSLRARQRCRKTQRYHNTLKKPRWHSLSSRSTIS